MTPYICLGEDRKFIVRFWGDFLNKFIEFKELVLVAFSKKKTS